MFEQLIVQIKHQYGKYLYFHNAYNDSKEPVYGNKQDYNEDETIVRFIPKNGGYQIQHQYGKYISFEYAYTKTSQKLLGMKQGYCEDETIVHIIPKDNGRYQIKHQYGKYLSFNHAYDNCRRPVLGINDGFEDETIVYFIPIKYTFSIKIEDFQYDTSKVYDAQLQGIIQQVSLISKTFKNNSGNNQRFSINESVALNTTKTFQHSTTDVTKWLNEVSVGVKITAEGQVGLPLVTNGRVTGEHSLGYSYTWGGESTKQFSKSTTNSVEKTINVTDEITVSPNSEMTYTYFKSQLSGIAIPYEAVMKIKCKMGGIYVSNEALQFILDHIGNCPGGRMAMENGQGIYSTSLTGGIIPDVALNFSTCCNELPI